MSQSHVIPRKDSFGHFTDGREVNRYTFCNQNDVTVRVIELGCVITDIRVPDKEGIVADINLGYDAVKDYETNPLSLGAICGRVVNVISNARFTLDDKEYHVTKNFGNHCIHGGKRSFTHQLWSSWIEDDKVKMKYVSADGEEGFPGELTTIVSYQLTNQNELVIEYSASTNKPTPVNLTNHAYFNLAGHNYPNLDEHVLQILADKFTPTKENDIYIPSGEIRDVSGTMYDLRQPVRLGNRLGKMPHGKGYFNNFCVTNVDGSLRLIAKLDHPPTGRRMEVYTTEPGVQCYTGGDTIPHTQGKEGAVYEKLCSICLETQHYPDSVNQESFPNTVLRPGQQYHSKTVYKFGLLDK
ncbi:galactose mutarotase-like [Saccostrea echinata]|uniref:galactose mutarotase-like n=1 Tax=Saccostrea echinata TaxID=191078 RepID=UPI002A83C6FC|nr:galactose mutarotase-like [Saccostrea echinata]